LPDIDDIFEEDLNQEDIDFIKESINKKDGLIVQKEDISDKFFEHLQQDKEFLE
jgi:hypothetical protein